MKAEVTFVERGTLRKAGPNLLSTWDVYLRQPIATDTVTGRRVTGRLLVLSEVVVNDVVTYWFKTFGRHPSGNRNHDYATFAQAQDAIVAWVGRRFKVEES